MTANVDDLRTSHPTNVSEVLSPDAWGAIVDTDEREDVRASLAYYLAEAEHEATSDRARRALARAAERLRTDLLYVERLSAALEERVEGTTRIRDASLLDRSVQRID